MNEIRKITAQAVPVSGDDIDTDRIIPARFMKCLTFDGLGEYAFYDVRFNTDGEEKDHPLNKAEFKDHQILLSNRNFGCGSSREHAPWALYGIGIRAIIAESYAEIFAGNCSNLGIAAVTLPHGGCEELIRMVEADPNLEITIDLESKEVRAGEKVYALDQPETYRLALTEGQWDTTSLLLDSLDRIDRVHGDLPRFNRAESH
ncbi:MAG: 3-isopropylmalate dehydratase small subunit [Spirochaetales bacterium]|nr:3-isopropylmalate dehydratase small subunit [Spirochaetales bacterium]